MKTGEERFSFPWERDAMRGDAMPEGLPLYDQAAYQATRYLYALYRRGEILERMPRQRREGSGESTR